MKTCDLSMKLAFGLRPGWPRCDSPVRGTNRERGTVLIIVLWIAFGLVTISLYFGHSMLFEFRAADNNAAAVEADQAIEGAVRYASYVLTNSQLMGQMPETNSYHPAAVPVGEANFWFIGRDLVENTRDVPYFGLVDEASKLNLNTATAAMLESLPRMTPELAAAIIDWRDSDDNVTSGGAESDYYLRRNPPYRCKNAPFETIEELQLVMGATPEILYGEDINRNGILDPNENDGEVSPPFDNRNGRLDPGILEYVTVYSSEPSTTTNGTPRLNVGNLNANQVSSVFQTAGLSADRIAAIRTALGFRGGAATTRSFGSVLELYVASSMTEDEFAQVEGNFIGSRTNGLININTASEAVLACIPGLTNVASSIVAYRSANAGNLTSVAWLVAAVNQDLATIRAAGPWITTHSYQFTADIAAVGHYGRGYRRTLFVIDTSQTAPRILYRRDMARLGWALGNLRQTWSLAKVTR